MFISLSTHIFVYHEFRDEFIDITCDSGIKSLELFAVYPHFHYRDEKSVQRLQALCADRGISIKSVHFPLYMHIDDIKKNRWLSLSAGDEELRLRSVSETIMAANIFSGTDEGVLVVHTSFPGKELPSKKRFLFIDSMKRIMGGIPPNVTIAIENTTGATGTASSISGLADSFPGDRVGICIDVGHANVVESPPSALATAGSRLSNVHISDNMGERDDHLPPGKGSINWPKVMKVLKGIEYRGPLTLEIRDPDRGMASKFHAISEKVRESTEFVTSLMGKMD